MMIKDKEMVKLAEQEYNDLRCFAGKQYPKGKCKNILSLFQITKNLQAKLLRECNACEKPHNCWIGCKVKFSVKELLEELIEK